MTKTEAPVWSAPVVGYGLPIGDRRVPSRRNNHEGSVDTPCFVYDPDTNDYVEQPASDSPQVTN